MISSFEDWIVISKTRNLGISNLALRFPLHHKHNLILYTKIVPTMTHIFNKINRYKLKYTRIIKNKRNSAI